MTRDAFGVEERPYANAEGYQILDPEEAIELANRLGRRGWMMFNPLMAGIAPDEAWTMLPFVRP